VKRFRKSIQLFVCDEDCKFYFAAEKLGSLPAFESPRIHIDKHIWYDDAFDMNIETGGNWTFF